MLFQIGPVTVDVFPFNAHAAEYEGGADFARKDILGRLPGREFVGEGDEKLRLTGQILPTKIGGMESLEALHGLRRAGERVMVLRGDGRVLGWHAIESISESHSMLGANGVGQVIGHDIALVRVDPPGAASGAGLLSLILSLFR